MSHELRTPLNAILGFSEALELNAVDTSNPERLTEYASIIHSSGKHLLSLLNDLLDISRIEAGKHALEEPLLDIEAVLHAGVGLFSENAKAKRMEITFDESVRPLIFRGDRRSIFQIFSNLLSNAIKFSLKGGKISIALHETEIDGKSIVIQDQGVGISVRDIEFALEPFGQVNRSLYVEENGSCRFPRHTGIC